jgi:hypothetical protein
MKDDIHKKGSPSLAVPMRSRELEQQMTRPAKVHKRSGDEFGRSDECVPGDQTSVITDTPSTRKDKGRSPEGQNELTTPAAVRTSGQDRIDNYSAFKGRGRYGNAENNQCAFFFFPSIQFYIYILDLETRR